MNTSSKRGISVSAGLGDGEERTEPYVRYGEGAPQSATPTSAPSTTEVFGSAKKQSSARNIFALVDCNNFFVSCERIFRPDLEGKPVVVLSSNDGCAVARSNEAKALGIPMGLPAFKLRQYDNAGHAELVRFSANFELYGDISKRIVMLLTSITPRLEVYSVDESFLDLSRLKIEDYETWGRAVRQKIMNWVGVPVSIGVAPTKTLAKLASERAKKVHSHHAAPACQLPQTTISKHEDCECGVVSLIGKPLENGMHQLKNTPLEDVWGVGWRGAPKWRAEGVSTALDLSRVQAKRAQQLMGIRGRQMVSELNGTSCYPLEQEGRASKSIMRTRTFGEDTSDAHVVEAALATFVSKASYALRRENQLTKRAGFFITTNQHKPGYKSWSREVKLSVPTSDNGILLEEIMRLFGSAYRPSYSYHRAGVFLYDFIPQVALQTDIFGMVDVDNYDRGVRRMKALDRVNSRFGRRTLYYATEELAHSWEPQHKLRSPRYVSNWEELPKAKIW